MSKLDIDSSEAQCKVAGQKIQTHPTKRAKLVLNITNGCSPGTSTVPGTLVAPRYLATKDE